MRILIAEDDATSRIVLVTVLKKWGHEVIATTDGEEALAVLQGDNSPNLAILDWMMPGLAGVDVCRMAREAGRSEPLYVILLTALGRESDIVTGLDAGADDYVTKPFSNDELRARIRVAERIINLQAALANRVAELEAAFVHIKTLQGVLPICMYCHKIRTDEDSWQKLEVYLQAHSDAEFSHGLCDDCLEEHYPKEPTGVEKDEFAVLKEFSDEAE